MGEQTGCDTAMEAMTACSHSSALGCYAFFFFFLFFASRVPQKEPVRSAGTFRRIPPPPPPHSTALNFFDAHGTQGRKKKGSDGF